jgi:hypothetical protein
MERLSRLISCLNFCRKISGQAVQRGGLLLSSVRVRAFTRTISSLSLAPASIQEIVLHNRRKKMQLFLKFRLQPRI